MLCLLIVQVGGMHQLLYSHYRGYRHRQIYNTIKDIKNNLEKI